MTGLELISEEYYREDREKRWDASWNDRHTKGELAMAAACYAIPPLYREEMPVKMGAFDEGWVSCSLGEAEFFIPERLWPWTPIDWKPTPHNRRRELAKAGAFIAAELERLDRLESK